MGRAWLASHEGYGAPIGVDVDEDEEEAGNENWQGKVAEWAAALVPIAEPVSNYLHKRRLVELPDPADAMMIPANIIGPGLVGLATTLRINSAPIGFQVLPLDAVSGEKVGRRRLSCFTLQERPEGPITFAPLPPPAVLREVLKGRPLILCEGWENQQSLKLAFPEATEAIVGVAGVGQLKKIQVFRGAEVIICRDGDPKGSPADRALTEAVDALILEVGQ